MIINVPDEINIITFFFRALNETNIKTKTYLKNEIVSLNEFLYLKINDCLPLCNSLFSITHIQEEMLRVVFELGF